jgi:hypothetical protein
MPRREGPKRKKKSVASLRLQNSALGADLEIFLPRGWRVTKANASKKKSRAKKVPSRKRRKR